MIEDSIKRIITRIILEIKASNKKYVIIHYTGVNADTSASGIKWYHTVFKKWSRCGYHHLINHDGQIEQMEPVWARVNGCASTGWWSKSNEKYVGKDAYQMVYETLSGLARSEKVNAVLVHFLTELVKVCPDIQIAGHREMPDLTAYNNRQQTSCPGFSVSDWLLSIGIPQKHIFYDIWKP